jgi:hypothetical protein
MSHIVLYAGIAGDENLIEVAFCDENGIEHRFPIEVNVLSQDKPRLVEVIVNGTRLTFDGRDA